MATPGALTFSHWILVVGSPSAELGWNPPATPQELQAIVAMFARALDPEYARRTVRHLRQRVETCVERKGDTEENPREASKCK